MQSMQRFGQRYGQRLGSLLAAIALVVTPAIADEGKGTQVRPEIGKPVQAAQELLKSKKGKDALAKVKEADAVGGKSPYETYVIELTKGQAASLAGEPMTAAAAFEAAAAMAPNGRVQLLAGAASQYYLGKNYAKAAEAAERYQAEGGNDPALRTVRIQALYLGGNYAQAGKELQADLKAAELTGKAVPEQLLQMLADIANRQKDNATFMSAMEKLVAAYPKSDYWASLLYSLSIRPGLSDRLALDILRSKKATDTLNSTDEYVEAVQLSLQAGFPWEANKFLTAGYDAKLLGMGAEASRHQRLKDLVAKALFTDQQALGQDDAKAATTGGDMLLNTGFNYVLRGQGEKGVLMMEQALTKGTLKRPEEAKLHVGMAQVMAGQKARALETLKGVTGKDGGADIARIWILLAKSAFPN
jgi:hypothetical protein